MSKKEALSSPPKRKELSDTPIKFCNEISRLFRAKFREQDKPDGVMSQHGAHLVLSTLAAGDGINQRELVSKTHLRPPTISVILQRMESEGLVERKPNDFDMRSISVYLTEEGRRLDRHNIERIKQIDTIAMSGISRDEAELLMSLLHRIRDNMLTDKAERMEDTEK